MTRSLLTGSNRAYGSGPELIRAFDPAWTEYMHFLYLPVVMPHHAGWRLPERLSFLEPLMEEICDREGVRLANPDGYVYVTARRGYATPGNPLNRPGWHSDGFGTDDVNYIWSDRWPTQFATGTFEDISDDHVLSAKQFDEQVRGTAVGAWSGEPKVVYRLDPSVIHSTPQIPAPGGERSFFKISISPDRYNLAGNSHNYLFSYTWKMWSRSEVRNDPAYAGGDSGPQS